jgi:hypothetical protein
MSTRVHFSPAAMRVAQVLHSASVVPDPLVLDALRIIRRQNPDLTFQQFLDGALLARIWGPPLERGLQ